MKDKTSLVFTGDIGFDRYMYGKWDDEKLLSDEVLRFLHKDSAAAYPGVSPRLPLERCK